MKNSILLTYLQWADSQILSLIPQVDRDSLSKILPQQENPIKQRLKHLAEEYLAWLYDIKGIYWGKAIKELRDKSTIGLIDAIQGLHEQWLQYLEIII